MTMTMTIDDLGIFEAPPFVAISPSGNTKIWTVRTETTTCFERPPHVTEYEILLICSVSRIPDNTIYRAELASRKVINPGFTAQNIWGQKVPLGVEVRGRHLSSAFNIFIAGHCALLTDPHIIPASLLTKIQDLVGHTTRGFQPA